MATQATPQPDEVMVDVFSPEGVKGKIPISKVQDYYGQGFTPAVRVTTPEGQGGWLPSNKVHDYLTTKGFKIGPPDQQHYGGGEVQAPGPKSNVHSTAPLSSAALGVASGLGVPESQHPILATLASLNPVKTVQRIRDAAAQGNTGEALKLAIAGPVGAGIIDASQQHLEQAKKDAQDSGALSNDFINYTDKVQHPGMPTRTSRIPASEVNLPLALRSATHLATAAVPVVGPAAYEAGSEIGEAVPKGDVDAALHGAGKGVGTILGLLAGTEKGQAAGAATVENVGGKTAAIVKKGTEAVTEAPRTVQAMLNPVKAAERLPAEDLAIKATKPRNSIQNVKGQIATALPDARRAADSLGIQVSNLDDANKAVGQAKRDVWQEYQANHLEPGKTAGLTIDGNKIANAMEGTINKRFATQNPDAAQAIKDLASQYRRPIPVAEAEDFLQSANNDLASYYAKNKVNQRTASLDPVKGHVVAEAGALRSELYKTLDSLSGSDAAALKKRYGALNTLEDVINRRINVAERAAPESLIEQMGKMEAAKEIGKAGVKLVTGKPFAAAADVYGAIRGVHASRLARQANDSNFLIGKAFEKTNPTATAKPAVIQPRKPIAGLLVEGPIITPPPADTSGSVPFKSPPVATTSRAQRMGLLLPEKVNPEATKLGPSTMQTSQEGLLPAARRVVRDPKTGRMKVQFLTSPAEQQRSIMDIFSGKRPDVLPPDITAKADRSGVIVPPQGESFIDMITRRGPGEAPAVEPDIATRKQVAERVAEAKKPVANQKGNPAIREKVAAAEAAAEKKTTQRDTAATSATQAASDTSDFALADAQWRASHPGEDPRSMTALSEIGQIANQIKLKKNPLKKPISSNRPFMSMLTGANA